MIKFVGVNKEDNSSVLGIGLSHGNVTKLLAGQPIEFNASEVGLPPLTIFIMGGETEEAMFRELRDLGVLNGVEIKHDRHPDEPRR